MEHLQEREGILWLRLCAGHQHLVLEGHEKLEKNMYLEERKVLCFFWVLDVACSCL